MEPDVLEPTAMIQITPQMKILVAIEAVDGRKGIDSLARLCDENSPLKSGLSITSNIAVR